MRKIERTIYKFEELDKKTQDRLIEEEKECEKDFYYESLLYADVECEVQEILKEKTDDKGLYCNTYYDLSCSQGSGLIVEFDMYITDINNILHGDLTNEEIKKIEDIGYTKIKVRHIGHYYHERSFDYGYQDYTYYCDDFEETQRKLDKLMDNFNEFVVTINKECYKKAYNLYYDFEPDRQWILERLSENEYYCNGEIYMGEQ